MNDLISRQAAIDVVDAVWSVTGDKNVAKVWDQIKDLPSAQPEQPEWAQAVERWYNKALCNPCIHKPLAWALYQVWKEYDNEG